MAGGAVPQETPPLLQRPNTAEGPPGTWEGAMVTAYDPIASENARAVLGSAISFAASAEAALKDADACIILTEWKEFQKLNWKLLAATMANPLVVDLRNIYSPGHASRMGINYISLGRNPVLRQPARSKSGVRELT